jgi:hypothetical protein
LYCPIFILVAVSILTPRNGFHDAVEQRTGDLKMLSQSLACDGDLGFGDGGSDDFAVGLGFRSDFLYGNVASQKYAQQQRQSVVIVVFYLFIDLFLFGLVGLFVF